MELVLPMNYVELQEDEMMYLDGGWGLGKHWWNSTGFIGTAIDVALVFVGVWSVKGQAAIKWIKNNVNTIVNAVISKLNISAHLARKILSTIGALAGIAGMSVGFVAAHALDAGDWLIGCGGLNGHCFE